MDICISKSSDASKGNFNEQLTEFHERNNILRLDPIMIYVLLLNTFLDPTLTAIQKVYTMKMDSTTLRSVG